MKKSELFDEEQRETRNATGVNAELFIYCSQY